MATNKQDFLVKSTNIRVQINSEFDNLIEKVNTRRNELLSKLGDVVSRYQRLVRESEQTFLQLEQLQLQSKNILNLSLTPRFQDAVKYGVDDEITSMKRGISNLDLSFEWTDDFEEMIADLGTIIVNLDLLDCWVPKIDYSLMNSPKISKEIYHFSSYKFAQCVCIDPNTLFIYVSFPRIQAVFVFDKFGDFLLQFCETNSSPHGIAILGDKIYVSSSSNNTVYKYRLCGKQTPKLIRTPDISKTELKGPTLMSIDESDGHVYVCDTGNRRVVRYNKFLNYHSEICGKDKFTPLNVKITQTRIILFVEPAPTTELVTHPIRLYSKEKYQFLKSLFVEPKGLYFDIDTSGNYLISLYDSLYVYDSEGHLLHVLELRTRCFAISRKAGNLITADNGVLRIY